MSEMCFKCESTSRRFQPGEGHKSLLRDCKTLRNLREPSFEALGRALARPRRGIVTREKQEYRGKRFSSQTVYRPAGLAGRRGGWPVTMELRLLPTQPQPRFY